MHVICTTVSCVYFPPHLYDGQLSDYKTFRVKSPETASGTLPILALLYTEMTHTWRWLGYETKLHRTMSLLQYHRNTLLSPPTRVDSGRGRLTNANSLTGGNDISKSVQIQDP